MSDTKVIVITSGKGGVGKTTMTANISTALAKLGKSVLVIDADIGLRNLDMILGLENRIVYDVLDAIEQRVSPEKALVKDKRGLPLWLLPANQTKNKDAIDPVKSTSFSSSGTTPSTGTFKTSTMSSIESISPFLTWCHLIRFMTIL